MNYHNEARRLLTELIAFPEQFTAEGKSNQVAQWQGAYDPLGNDTLRFNAQTGADRRSMTWDAFGRLASVKEGMPPIAAGCSACLQPL